MRYLMVTENQEFYMANEVKEEELEAADGGIWDVVDTETMTQYYEGEWHKVPNRDEI